ncbi:MAG TPA: hypothetical protein VIS06_13215, partial [Mycobacteriales bacterium]
MLDNEDHIYFRSGNTGAWSGWRRLPTSATFADLSVTVGFDTDLRREDLFAVSVQGAASGGGVYHATVTDLGAFSGWQEVLAPSLVLDVNTELSAVAPEPGSLVVFISNTNTNLLQRYDQGAWQPLQLPPYLDPWCIPAPLPSQSCDFVSPASSLLVTAPAPRPRPLVGHGHPLRVAHPPIHR